MIHELIKIFCCETQILVTVFMQYRACSPQADVIHRCSHSLGSAMQCITSIIFGKKTWQQDFWFTKENLSLFTTVRYCLQLTATNSLPNNVGFTIRNNFQNLIRLHHAFKKSKI